MSTNGDTLTSICYIAANPVKGFSQTPLVSKGFERSIKALTVILAWSISVLIWSTRRSTAILVVLP